MFGKINKRGGDIDSDDAFDLLQEMEAGISDDVRQQRAHFRVAVKSKLILRPGNARERPTSTLEGITGDVSEGGCRALFPVPVQVGDVYYLEFDNELLGLPQTYARCVRCSIVREDAFEAGFQFFQSLSLPEDRLARITAAGQSQII